MKYRVPGAFALALFACASVEAQGIAWIWSGAVTPSSAIVKGRVSPGTEGIRLVVGDRSIPREGFAAPDENGVVAFSVQNLTPGTSYEYRLEAEGSSPLSGRFRTFDEAPMSFDFVFGSCARTGSNHEVFETMESLAPLFVLHMGDFHYENIGDNDPAEFREAFEEVLESRRQSSLYRSAPIAYIWDDHDYGPNDSDRTHRGKPAAIATYDQYVPHYPLDRSEGEVRTIHQAFSVGRLRFLLTDVRSERVPDYLPDGPEKSMLGVAQREWLLSELEAARDRYALVVWVNVVPWITEPGSGHGWGRYDWERRYLADRIRELGMVDRLLVLSGDGHMVAIDDGSNSNFATDAGPGEPGFPVVHAAPFDRYPRPKGGPYSHGTYARRGFLFGLIQVQQFGLAEVEDDGEVLQLRLSGRGERGELLDGMSIRLRCDTAGCRVLPDEETAAISPPSRGAIAAP